MLFYIFIFVFLNIFFFCCYSFLNAPNHDNDEKRIGFFFQSETK